MKVFFGALFVSFILASQVFAAPARILIIRHGEKPANTSDGNLSPRGYQRAQALTSLFSRQPQLLAFGRPVSMFAFNNFGDGSNRGIETATPLANTLGIPVNSSFRPSETSDIAKFIFETAAFNHKMVMIVWRHSDMQALATALGIQNAPAWQSNVFDRIWEIDYTPLGQVSSFKDLPENLLPGDSN